MRSKQKLNQHKFSTIKLASRSLASIMALRHPVPKFDVASLVREGGAVVPRFPDPPAVVFRPGTNKEEVVQQILEHRCALVNAAVGAGKSVRLPALLADATRGLVVHCVPSRLLAWALYDYVSTQTEVPTSFMDDVAEPLPVKGLVFMSNVQFAFRMVAWRSGAVAHPESLSLFMDESHESDFASGVLREVARSQDYIKLVAFSTATSGPVESRKREAAGEVREHTYAWQPVADWDMDDMSKPWAPATFSGNALVLVDKQSEADILGQKFGEHGLAVHRLSAKMSLAEFQATWYAIKDPLQGMNVTLADYAFRSGFTMIGFTRYIETGKVVHHSYDGEQTLRLVRDAYRFEVYQGTARIGRTPGSYCDVYVPNLDFANVICDLEETEIDAAALLFRMMGYQPPRKFTRASPFSQGKVPRDLYAAFNSPLSMRGIPEEDLCHWSELFTAPPQVVQKPVRKVGSPVLIPPRPRSPCGISPADAARQRLLAREAAAVAAEERRVSVVQSGVGLRSVGHEASVELPPVRLESESLDGHGGSSVSGEAVRPVLTKLEIGPRSSFQSDDSVTTSETSSYVSSPTGYYAKQSDTTEEVVPVEDIGLGLGQLCADVAAELEARGDDRFMQGQYVYFPGIEMVVNARGYFAEGYHSLERVFEGLSAEVAVKHWTVERRMAATRLAVDYYNDSLLQINALKAVVKVYKENFAAASEYVDVTVVFKWLASVQEAAVEYETKVAASVRVLRVLQERGFKEKPANGESEREVEVGRAWLQVLSDVAAMIGDSSGEAYAKAWVDKPLPAIKPPLMREIAFHEAEGSRTRGLIKASLVSGAGEKEDGRRELMARRSGLPWLRAEGNSVRASGVGGGTIRDRIGKALAALKE